jgi:hypothetical protein
MKSKAPKSTVVRGNEAQDGVLPSGYPFYTFDESTYPLASLTRYAVRFREFQRMWRQRHGSLASESDLVLAQSQDYEGPFNWLQESRLIRVVAALLGTKQPAAALQCLCEGLKAYEEGFVGHSNKDQAKIHLILACDSLWDEGSDRDGVTKAQIKDRARMLWAESVCRRKNQRATQVNMAKEQASLPHVDWPLNIQRARARRPQGE